MNIIESKVVKMKVGFIGGGNMGGALIGGLTQKCCAPSDIALYEKDAQKAAAFKEMGINTVESASAAEAASEIIVFSVKPNIIDSVLSEMSGDKNKIYLSIAAGVTVAHLEEMLGADKKIVRAMPNTPAQVGCGMTVISPNKNVDDEDIKKVKMLLSAVGMVQQMDEKFMSVATALHGSSPAYVYMFIDAMADAGVKYGLTKQQALTLAAQAVAGSAEMVLSCGEHPEKLKDNVCSPGGTTIAAVCDLEKNGFRGIVQSAVCACVAKADEMSK